MDRDVEKNAAYIRHLSVNQIKSELLQGFSLGYFLNLSLSPRRDITKELRTVFEALPSPAKNDFKNALILAFIEATPPLYEARVIQELAFLAASIKASGIVKHLSMLLLDSSSLHKLPDDEYVRTTSVLYSVLSGFLVSIPKVDASIEITDELGWETLEQLYLRGAKFDRKFASQAFLSLCLYHRDSFPIYFRRYLELFDSHIESEPTYKYVFRKFARIIDANVLRRHLNKLRNRELIKFIQLLCMHEFSLFNLKVDEYYLDKNPGKRMWLTTGTELGYQDNIVLEDVLDKANYADLAHFVSKRVISFQIPAWEIVTIEQNTKGTVDYIRDRLALYDTNSDLIGA